MGLQVSMDMMAVVSAFVCLPESLVLYMVRARCLLPAAGILFKTHNSRPPPYLYVTSFRSPFESKFSHLASRGVHVVSISAKHANQVWFAERGASLLPGCLAAVFSFARSRTLSISWKDAFGDATNGRGRAVYRHLSGERNGTRHSRGDRSSGLRCAVSTRAIWSFGAMNALEGGEVGRCLCAILKASFIPWALPSALRFVLSLHIPVTQTMSNPHIRRPTWCCPILLPTSPQFSLLSGPGITNQSI